MSQVTTAESEGLSVVAVVLAILDDGMTSTDRFQGDKALLDHVVR